VGGIPDLMPKGVDKRIKKMTEAWNNLSFDYDAFIGQTTPERLHAIDAPLLAQCAGGRVVLEIGCGTARLRERVTALGSEYIGLDPSLKLLQQRVAPGERDLVCGVGEYLPFPDQHFDTIIGGFHSFRYIRFDQLYPECARVLKPSGVLAFTLWNNWALFFHSLINNVRQKNFRAPPFKIENCNDVVSPAREVKRLAGFGLRVTTMLSTKSVPILQRVPGIKRFFNWQGYWRGQPGAWVGYDIVFICQKDRV
jgi:SAM-dependent methyltransferase